MSYYIFDLDVEHAGCLNRVKVWAGSEDYGDVGEFYVDAQRPYPFGDSVGAEEVYDSPLAALIAGLECVKNAAEAEDDE